MARVPWRLAGAFLTAAAVVAGLVFLANWPTYVYFFIVTALAFTTLGVLIGRKIDELKRQSLTDSLTGLANRRAFQARLREEWRKGDRYQLPLSLLLIDIDGLKQINDDRGHAAGDEVLKSAARAIRSTVRATDFGARWGGDEFAIVAPNTMSASARQLAQRLLGQLSRQARAGDVAATTSVGVATLVPGRSPETIESLLKAADAALYQAKREGRNRVRVA